MSEFYTIIVLHCKGWLTEATKEKEAFENIFAKNKIKEEAEDYLQKQYLGREDKNQCFIIFLSAEKIERK